MQRQVHHFTGEKAMHKGVARMSKKGWRLENSVSSIPRRGCLGRLFLGRKKTEFTVTFARD